MTLAEKVKRLRKAKQMSVARLAEVSKVSSPYIWQIESGRRANPTGDILKRLAAALDTSVSDLAGAPITAGVDSGKRPKSLQSLLNKRGKELGMTDEDADMLKHIHYRGRRPETSEDWTLLFLFIKRILG
jgi:transcriptional regulator with XRE-family HTH domain